jgi:two-component system phosphate regulon sensor histidine kinase PhoR
VSDLTASGVRERPGPFGLGSPLFRRIFPATVVLAFLPLLATAIVALALGRRAAAEEAATRLRADALLMRESCRDALEGHDGDAADRLAKRLGHELETRFTLVDGKGVVLGDSDHDPRTMDNHGDRTEIALARENGVGQASRLSATLNRELFYVAVRVDDARPEAGTVRAALPASVLEARFKRSLVEVAAVAAPLGLIAFFALALTLLAVVRAVGEVTDAARSVASGRRVERTGAAERQDEIGDLARSVHGMAEELERRIVTIAHERNELATIVAGMGEGLLAVDGRGRLLLSNDVAARLLGLEGPLASGKDLVDLVPHGAIVSTAREALTEHREVSRTVEIFLAHAPARTIEARATPLEDGDGAVLLLRDVTEAARYERLRREFVANVSHELRTPLSLVKGFLETLEDGALKDEEKAPRFLAIASRHVVALEALVEDLLTLGRLDAGAETRLPGPVNLAEAAESVLSGFEEVARKKNLALRREIAPELPPALGHRDLIERAIRNLVDNAIKYTEQGEVRVKVAAQEDGLVIEVSDTGLGIPRDDLGRIFERFYRVEKSRSREAGGTGLGLAIVKHIAQQEGGTVAVESEFGKGSRFRLTLRIALPSGEGVAREL